MSYTIRPITEDEYPDLARSTNTAFGGTDLTESEDERSLFEFDRSLAAFDGDRIVGTAGVYSFELTLPGLTAVAAAGVTWVGVLPTHRRQGVLSSMMATQLDDVHERGEPLAILTASESVIYGRFGYGWATNRVALEIDPRHGAFREPFEPAGRVRLVDAAEAGKVLPGIYDRWRRQQPAAISRRQEWWELVFRDLESRRHGASGLFYAVHESEPGQADGYAMYRVKQEWAEVESRSELRLGDLVALTPDAHAALWRYCLGVDLIGKVTAHTTPVDEPVRWHLTDPRRLKVTGIYDFLWARIVDVPAALSARRYAVEGRLVVDVHDQFRPQSGGRFVLEGGPDGAECTATDAEPDLAMGVAELGAGYLGGVTFTSLSRADRVDEQRPGALAQADAMFASAPAPFCNTGF